jgi:hypothetical protein
MLFCRQSFTHGTDDQQEYQEEVSHHNTSGESDEFLKTAPQPTQRI